MKTVIITAIFMFAGGLKAADGGPLDQPVPTAAPTVAAYLPYTGVDAAPMAMSPVARPVYAPAALSQAARPYAAPLSPTAAPYPYAAPTAVRTAVPSIYKPYVAPAPAPTPNDASVKTTTVSFYKPRWGLGLQGGGAVPLGDLTLYNTSGGAGSFSLLYLPTETITVDVFASYSTQPYKFGGGASALNMMGGGMKLEFELMRVEALSAFAGAGAGYLAVQRTQQVMVGSLAGLPVYAATTQNTGGIALLFCFGIGYDFSSHWGLLLDLNVINVSLGGGTSDSLMIAQPNVGLKYTF